MKPLDLFLVNHVPFLKIIPREQEVYMISHLFFDFDGVLHNTFDVHLQGLRDYSGKDLTEQEYRDLHNGNFFNHNQGKLKDLDWLGYREYMRSHMAELTMGEQMKGAVESLGKKYSFAMVSSSGEKMLHAYLEKNKIQNLFQDILGAEFHHSKEEKFKYLFKKYEIDSSSVLFITDTLGDILEANAVGMKTIAVTFGFHDRETLAKGDPKAIVESPEELLESVLALPSL